MLLSLLFWGNMLSAQFTIPEKPAFQTSVYDYAKVLNETEKQQLEEKLIHYSDSTTTQIVVITIESLKGEDIGILTPKWGHAWGIGGTEKNDNGVIILLAKAERKIWISAGYGLEDRLTAGIGGEITRSYILPEFKKGSYYQGLDQGTSAIIDVFKGKYKGERKKKSKKEVPFIPIAILVLVALFLMSRNKNNNSGNNNGSSGQAPESSQISTSSTTDFWTETTDALRSMVGNAGGRAVISSPQSGTIAVRAMPDELRQVESFLRASRMSIERQVMLEAKIIEVELRDGYQSGIDWSVLKKRTLIGQTSGFANNPLLGNTRGLPTLGGADASSLGIDNISVPAGAAGTIGLSLSTNGFQAVMGFLESHGDLQILSSPRVATLNNQKAVLKVGTDEYFVTNVSGGTINSSNNLNNGTTTLPSLTLTPFFSGIALDVTPQIDEADTITLHIHPSVTSVTEKTKTINLGTIGTYKLPLASSNVNETDTVVRVLDGNIVAIGGLMQMEGSRQNSGLPGSADNVVTRTLFGNNANAGRKKELVVLIKPTIIRSAEDWAATTRQNAATLEDMNPGSRRVITVDGAKPATAP